MTFANAWNWLNPATQARIQNITYIDPAAPADGLPLPTGVKGTNVSLYSDASDLVNLALQLFGAQPAGDVNKVPTGSCGHDANCIYQTFAAQLSVGANDCNVGAGSVFGLSERITMPVEGGFGSSLFIFDPAPVPSVSSKITYNLP